MNIYLTLSIFYFAICYGYKIGEGCHCIAAGKDNTRSCCNVNSGGYFNSNGHLGSCNFLYINYHDDGNYTELCYDY